MKNSFELHPKMNRTMTNGMTVHAISSLRLPWIGVPVSSFDRRRYFTAKYTTRPEMSSVKNAVSATRKK